MFITPEPMVVGRAMHVFITIESVAVGRAMTVYYYRTNGHG